MNKYRVVIVSPHNSCGSPEAVYLDAKNFEILRDGTLIFINPPGSRTTKAIAAGWWSGVELVKWNSGSGSWEGGEE